MIVILRGSEKLKVKSCGVAFGDGVFITARERVEHIVVDHRVH